MNIHTWLESFEAAWIAKDTVAVVSLFDDTIEYWESPHKRLAGKKDIALEWGVVVDQKDIALNLELFSSDGNTHTVRWNLDYALDGTGSHWAGVYLIRLNATGKCTFFYQIGESSS